MHPDEATEQIVTVALTHKKPFAVTPCCVLPQLFPNRRVGNAPVRKLGAFLVYLRSLDPRIRTAQLPIPGRNTILFMTSADFLLDPPRRKDPAKMNSAAKRGDLALLQELREAGEDWSAETCQAASWGGHLAVLTWLREEGCEFDKSSVDAAIKGNRWEVLRWLVERGCPGSSEIAWDAEGKTAFRLCTSTTESH
jgi:hypothetical protein